MLQLNSPTTQKRVVDAIVAANEGEGVEVRLGLIAKPASRSGAEEDLAPYAVDAEWGQEESPITLDATISGHLPNYLTTAPTSLYIEHDGILLPQVPAAKTTTVSSTTRNQTDLISSSPFSLSSGEDAIKMGRFTDYRGRSPERVAWDAAARLPYDKSRIRIDDVQRTSLDYNGAGEYPGFGAEEPVGAVFSRLSEERGVGYHYRDTADRGLVIYLQRPLGRGHGDVPDGRFRVYSHSRLPNWETARPTPPALRYSAVRVFHNDPQTGRLLYESVWPVDYPEGVVKPHRGRTKEIAIEDGSDTGPAYARSRAIREAQELARAPFEGADLTLPAFDPLIEKEDPFWVNERIRDFKGEVWEIFWRMRVSGYRHSYGATGTSGGSTKRSAASLTTTVSYTATVLNEDRIHVPTMLLG